MMKMWSWLGLKNSEPKPVIELMQRISKRAEDLSIEEQAKSYVSTGGIAAALENRDNRIIFGRRGTGKTHLLAFASRTVREKSDIPIFVDMRTIGSNNSLYGNTRFRLSDRATRLLRDFVDQVYSQLLERFTDPKGGLSGRKIGDALEDLGNVVRTITVDESVQTTQTTSDTSTDQAGVEASATVSTSGRARAGVRGSVNTQTDLREGYQLTTTGLPFLSLDIGGSHRAFEKLAEKCQKRIWIFIDEWSSIPEDIQPFIADFIRRAFFTIQNVTVQIAAIEYRSSFREDIGNARLGFELGSDIFADINLDDFFVYENNPNTAVEFFRNILYKHLLALADAGELAEATPQQVTDNAFTQEPCFRELVRASEGVPRDFINILQIAAMRSAPEKISVPSIRTASKDWFERDKESNIEGNERARKLLHWIRDQVIARRKARAFLLESTVRDETIEFLFDERLLHIAKRNYSSRDEPGKRYKVLKVDYGCYVDLINTFRAPSGFLFENVEADNSGEIVVPEDDYRAVRRAILNLEEFESDSQSFDDNNVK